MRRTFSILFLLTVSILIIQSADSSPTDWLQNELLRWDQSIFQVDISPKGRFYAVSGYQDVELYDISHQLIWHNRETSIHQLNTPVEIHIWIDIKSF